MTNQVQWLVGSNGQGKTNFLEAVYLLLTTKSFRTATVRDVIGEGDSKAVLDGALERQGRTRRLHMTVGKGIEQRRLDGKNAGALEYLAQSCVIAFTARSKEIIQGPPETRRLFVDRHVAHFDKQHIVDLGRHRKNLQQLRRVVQGHGDLMTYRSFKQASINVAERIVKRRMEYLASWKEKATEIFGAVFGYSASLQVRYRIRNEGKEAYGQRMMALCAAEMLHRRMLMGPQLDDLEIVCEAMAMRQTGSSGQVRAGVLSLKLAIAEMYRRKTGTWPVLILDDVDAELDNRRISSLLGFVSQRGQTLISTSKYGTIKAYPGGAVFLLKGGNVIPERTSG